MPLSFRHSPSMTFGVEMELQLLKADTFRLAAASPAIFARWKGDHSRVSAEIFQSMMEVKTGVCSDMRLARADLRKTLQNLRRICRSLRVRLASAGSHPISRYLNRLPYPGERYKSLIDRNQWLARRLCIFGLHVHVGMRDGKHAAAMVNAMLPYLPHLLALSASSPFWQEHDTGLASARATVFEAVPTGGHPCTFKTWKEFEALYDAMVASQSITSIKDIWWDIRPHPDLGTVEVRVCDALPTLSETLAVVALVYVLFRKFDAEYRRGASFAPPPEWIIRENKWRAARWGLDADIVLDSKGRLRPLRKDIGRLLDELEAKASSLNCGREWRTLRRMLAQKPSYERQRAVFEREGSCKAVAESLAREFETDEPVGA